MSSIYTPPSKGSEIPQLEQYGSQQPFSCNSCHSIYQLEAKCILVGWFRAKMTIFFDFRGDVGANGEGGHGNFTSR